MSPIRPVLVIPLLVLSALIGGCVTVGADQLDSLRRAMPTTDPAVRAAAPYAWDLHFAGGIYTVYPATPGGGRLVFGSVEGIRIHWDGAAIVKVEGMPGAVGLLETGVEGAERWFARDGSPTIRLGCTPRRDWRLSATQQGWRVECTGSSDGRRLSAAVVVEYDGLGEMRRLESTIVPGLSPMLLRRRQK